MNESQPSPRVASVCSVFFLALLLTAQLQAQLKPTPLVLVSDIDDTIKVSKVLDKDVALANATRTENVFRGMADLYTILNNNYPHMALVYLTNAQENLMMALHHKFITDNGFPEGLMLLRKNIFDSDHKINRLREIIKMTGPRVMILIGDNGEADVQVLDEIRKEYPQIIFLNYIRQLYSILATEHKGQALLPGEMGFVTPIEIAIDLVAKKLMAVPQAQALIDQIVPQIVQSAAMEDEDGRRGELSFPMWEDCRDFKWPAALDLSLKDIQRDNLIKTLKDRIQSRCSHPGRD